MQVDDRPRREPLHDDLGDRSRVALEPVRGVDRPQHGGGQHPRLGDAGTAQRVLAVGRPEQLGRVAEQPLAAGDVVRQLVVGAVHRVRMAERVVADLVALGQRAGQDLLPPLDRLAQHEEGAAAVMLAQQVEDGRRLWRRSVVERQRHQRLGQVVARPDDHGCSEASVARRPSAIAVDGRQPSSRAASEQSRQLRSSSPRRAG